MSYGYGVHPDDEVFHTGTWADEFATYEDACRHYGVDTPAQLAAEAEAYRLEWLDLSMDEMEARGGPNPDAFHLWGPGGGSEGFGVVGGHDDGVPF